MALSINGINNLCEITNQKRIRDVNKELINSCISFYGNKLENTDSLELKKKYKNIISFLKKCNRLDENTWVDYKFLKRELIHDYVKTTKKDKFNTVIKLYERVFTLSEVKTIIESYKKKNRILLVTIVLVGLVTSGFGALVLYKHNNTSNTAQDYQELQEQVVTVTEDVETDNVIVIHQEEQFLDNTNKEETKTTKEKVKEKVKEEKKAEETTKVVSVDFEQLTKSNPDIKAYIWFEGSEVGYPIAKGNDNEEYLQTDYKGNYSFAGTLFMDYRNSADLTDPCTVIYGHNMKNGSMFGSLDSYLKKDYLEENRFVQILTPTDTGRYEVVAANYVASTSNLYKVGSFGLKDTLESDLVAGNKIDSDYHFKLGDKVVMLSTCTGLGYKSRLAILLKRL